MLFRLVRPMRREGSQSRYYVKRIPADLRGRIAGLKLDLPIGGEVARIQLTPSSQSVRVSLRSSDPAAVKARVGVLDAYLDTVWSGLRRNEPVPLSHMQATALAGEVYHAWASRPESVRTTAIELTTDRRWVAAEVSPLEEAGLWDAGAVHIAEAMADSDRNDLPEMLEEKFGALLDRLLLDKGISETDRGSRDTALLAIGRAIREAFHLRQRNADGDYSPDGNVKRFPAWQPQPNTAEARGLSSSVSLSILVEEWWAEAKAAGRSRSTYESYRNTARRLQEFLGHDDADRVTVADIVAFKDARIAAGRSPKTVKDSDIAGLKSVFQRALQNGRLQTNPAASVAVMRTKPTRTRSKSFTLAEASSILLHASRHTQTDRENAKTAAAKRWAPWLCAYTGARIGEIAQLRHRDLRMQDGLWVITVTPEAGTVKDKQARDVVLHQHLIDEGFLAYVKAAGHGHLFYSGKEGDDLRGPWRTIKNRLVDFVREVVTDRNVAPNHGWRHLFKTIGRECGIEDRVIDAIQGHAPHTEGGRYGEVNLQAKARAIAMFPRYKTEAP